MSTVVEVPETELSEPVTPPAMLLEAAAEADPYLVVSLVLDEGPGVSARLEGPELAG